MSSSTLNADELNALMSAIQDGRVAEEPPEPGGPRTPVVPYDLTSQDRIIRGQMPTLDAMNEQIASVVGIGLSGRTRMNINLVASPATLLKFADFSMMLASPSVVAVLELGGSSGLGLLVLDPGLGESLLSAALGDRRGRPAELGSGLRRELTGVEQVVLRKLLSMFTGAMRTAWAPVLPLEPSVRRFETDARLAMVAPPNDVAIVSTFQVEGPLQGRIQLVIPYASVESAKARLASPPRSSGAGDARFARELARELEQVPLQLRALLGETRVHLSRLLDLKVGDLLTLATEEDKPVPVYVQDRLKLTALPRVTGGGLAVELASDVSPPEPPSSQPAE